jgi:hypothetical protein
MAQSRRVEARICALSNCSSHVAQLQLFWRDGLGLEQTGGATPGDLARAGLTGPVERRAAGAQRRERC